MNTKVYGVIIGTGAAVTVGLGFVPDRVVVANVTGATLPVLSWARAMRAAGAGIGGHLAYRGNDDTAYRIGVAAAAGVAPFLSNATVADGTASYKVQANRVEAFAGDMRAKTGTSVDGWTLDTAGNRTGHFSAAIDTTYVGVGSEVCVNGVFARITAITSTGATADQVTLDTALPSGRIDKITYKSAFVTAPAGTIMPDGIVISDVTANVSGEVLLLEAEQYDY